MNATERDDQYSISFSDFKAILKQHRSKIFACTVGMALFAAFWTLTKEPKYIVESSFKEKGKTQVGLTKSLTEALFSGGAGGAESEAISMMKSKKLTEKLVQNLNLQGKVFKDEKTHEYLNAMWDNIIIDIAHFNNERHPVLADLQPPLLIQDIGYDEEVPLGLGIKFTTEDHYIVTGPNGDWGEGDLDVPFEHENVTFTLTKNVSDPVVGIKYGIELQPLFYVAENISRNLLIVSEKSDKNLLVLRLPYRDRHLGAKILNELMDLYREFLHEEHQRISQEQLDYLTNRRVSMGTDLKQMMDEHALNLASDLSSTGFPNSTKAMEFMANAQNDYRQKLLSIDLESKRLQKAQNEDYIYYDRYTSHGDPIIINEVLAEIRGLKQQADSLDLALRETQKLDDKMVVQQMAELDQIELYSSEADKILHKVRNSELPSSDFKLIADTRYNLKTWYDKWAQAHKGLNEASSKNHASQKATSEHWKTNFSAYLTNLQHILEVNKRTLQERLSHQQVPPAEFQGIDLSTAKELYINFNRQLSETQAQGQQISFVLSHMEKPDFEMSALSSVLNDSVSREMINKASMLALSLQDQNNRSVKEQERIKEELSIEKGFLELHLKQTLQLLGVRETLLKEKILSLQNVTLGLVHQRISILEKHLDEFITTRLNNLKQERSLIHDNQLQLQKEMAKLPNKWVAEKLIDQQMTMNQLMVEELTKMVESKNISTNLEMVLSGPVDQAIAPILPKSPRLLLYLILGTIVGGFLSLTYFIVTSVMKGIKASPENILLARHHVSGKISSQSQQFKAALYSDSDLETLRKAISFLAPSEGSHEVKGPRPQSLAIIQGNAPDYAVQLAELFAKKGLRVVYMNLKFDEAGKTDQMPGLLQFIEGESPGPKINRSGAVDFISPGGITRFSDEIICSPAFSDLIFNLQDKYDWIIVSSPAKPCSAQAEALMKFFDHTIVNLRDETVPELQSLFSLANEAKPKKKTTFIFYS